MPWFVDENMLTTGCQEPNSVFSLGAMVQYPLFRVHNNFIQLTIMNNENQL